jgi:N-carbamoyl-L-amino-acid hydrolase
MTFEQMWRGLVGVGRSASSGGYFRQPFGAAERECAAWFAEQARARGLDLRGDGFGNTVAWWGSGPDAVLTGSHLDSVLDGGAFDGPLGVVSAFAAVDLLRERGFEPSRPIGVAAFVEEEGSRFGRACLGSSLAVGAMSSTEAEALRDRDGRRLGDVWAGAGLDPSAGSALLDDVGWFVELHVEQGRDLVQRGAAIAVARGIWPHGRYRFDFTGEANHAGTTRMEDRRDPMLTYASTALGAAGQARARAGRATFGRLAVEPNGTNAVPSHVTAWLDARAAGDESLAELVDGISRAGGEHARRDGTRLDVTVESVSAAVTFPPDLAHRIAAPRGWPVIATQAGHDAGILATAGIPTAMLFVRNPTGVSHSPAEHAETDDCLTGVVALADTLAELAR